MILILKKGKIKKVINLKLRLLRISGKRPLKIFIFNGFLVLVDKRKERRRCRNETK